MTAIGWITIGAAIGIVSPWLYLRAKNRQRQTLSRGPAQRARSTEVQMAATRLYAAVSVDPGRQACRAAKKLEGERFLSTEAPSLPLADCDESTCGCHYRKHEDRRADEDRRNNLGRFGGFAPHQNNDKRSAARDRRTKAHDR